MLNLINNIGVSVYLRIGLNKSQPLGVMQQKTQSEQKFSTVFICIFVNQLVVERNHSLRLDLSSTHRKKMIEDFLLSQIFLGDVGSYTLLEQNVQPLDGVNVSYHSRVREKLGPETIYPRAAWPIGH